MPDETQEWLNCLKTVKVTCSLKIKLELKQTLEKIPHRLYNYMLLSILLNSQILLFKLIQYKVEKCHLLNRDRDIHHLQSWPICIK